MIHPLRFYGDPILRRAAPHVDRFDGGLAALASDMIETMHHAHGVGLAAPQIGVAARLFVAQELAEPEEGAAEARAGAALDAPSEDRRHGSTPADEVDDGPEVVAEHVMVNPVITQRGGLRVAPDGCLSVPGLWIEDMERSERVVVRYQDLSGRVHEREAHGHFAHVIQHETDHLDGILFFDRLPPPARTRFLEEHRAELAELQRRAKAFLKELREGAPGSR